ncbi:MAG: type I-C CRISPR-associated protein Cas8c/Csd1 [Candidatus Vecturithrix sp.]|jgi:CRISPR-associated protein Csd1|nr:type I-C CRISPR-associated protein Cas8c/Csd1 [Candidatus Vecturithrix sp.]
MSWIQKLYETYEKCLTHASDPPNPIAHTTQMAHIEIVIDEEGNFRKGRAKVIENKEEQKTLIPCTEESGGRSGKKPKNHPLCDKLQYVAGDFVQYGGLVTSGFTKKPSEPYENLLEILGQWRDADHHPMVTAIHNYISKGTIISDLISDSVLPSIKTDDDDTIVADSFEGDKKSAPAIFRALPPGQVPMDAFVRFRIEGKTTETASWESESLNTSWISFYKSLLKKEGFCSVTGRDNEKIADNYPAKLRHDADKAKLISSNDLNGYTFLGKFLDANQAASVSYEVAQKAHIALQWLIRRQAFRSGDQVFVTWATSGKPIPDPCANSWSFLGDEFQMDEAETAATGDVGQAFAMRFNRKLAGYKANISDTEDIVVMGLNSATPGRMAMTFYRELTGSEFLERIEKWHTNFAWFQNYGKYKNKNTKKEVRIIFEGAPAPKDIAWCAYGKKVEGKNGIKLLNATVERLLPSIVDGRPVPHDLVEQCVRRVSNRTGLERWEFEKCLGIACSLYKGFFKERGYIMALEEERNSRDYLYGRLLAVAEKIESMALYFAKEKRETIAARLMQRFADRPYSTWRTIEISLTPYKSRINAKTPGLLAGYQELVDQICCQFQPGEFMTENRLSGEFLLAYHCQRKWLREHKRENGRWKLKLAEEIEIQDKDEEE